MTFRLYEGTTKGSRLAKSRLTGETASSTLNECSGRRLMAQPSMWAFTPAGWLVTTRLKLDKDHKKTNATHISPSRKGKGKYKEETIEKMQE